MELSTRKHLASEHSEIPVPQSLSSVLEEPCLIAPAYLFGVVLVLFYLNRYPCRNIHTVSGKSMAISKHLVRALIFH